MGDAHSKGFHGPKCWILTTLAGILVGFAIAKTVPLQPATNLGSHSGHGIVKIEQINADKSTVVIYDANTPPSPHNSSHADSNDHSSNASHHDNSHEDLSGVSTDTNDNFSIIPSPTQQQAVDAILTSATAASPSHGPSFDIPLWLLIPFALMLLSIALMPFINEHFWHQHFPDFAFFLGALVTTYYLVALGGHGIEKMTHVALEYYAFIALIGGLFVASGGILIDVRTSGRPAVNTALFAFGALFANIVGTTGASVLLIRPFMRINKGRLKPLHVVFFIFIISNCGGSLTPIGDPPLYLGYLRGVPFEWTLIHLWPMWMLCIGTLLTLFFIYDSRVGKAHEPESIKEVMLETEPQGARIAPGVHIKGAVAIFALVLLVAGVFIDKILSAQLGRTIHGVGPTFQIIVAAAAFFLAPKTIHEANSFNFFPVKEVGLLFIGIFATMVPALEYLAANGSKLGLESPTHFYYATGALSACLDNAPTYLNFLQAQFGVLHKELTPDNINQFVQAKYLITHADTSTLSVSGTKTLAGISLGAVFFGAMTYIGNGPNFMVKSIAESSGLKMPSFFGYLVYSLAILLPVIILVWAVFIQG